MSRTKQLTVVSAVACSFAIVLGYAAPARADWAAVVYAPSTGAIGLATGHSSADSAMAAARQNARNPSNPVYAYTQDGYCVILVDRYGRYAWGQGSTYADAVRYAQRYCPNGTVRIWAYSR